MAIELIANKIEAAGLRDQFLKLEEKPVKKAIMIALSVIFALGMILSYAVGAPWFVILSFFALTFAPLFPLGKVKSVSRNRPPEN